MSRAIPLRIGINQANDHLIELISPWVQQVGYQIIHLEVQTHRQKTLRIFIDHLNPKPGQAIGIEDCVKVTKALEGPLDQNPEVESAFQGNYELEISSPGVDRPLRTADDFKKFAGNQVRIHVFRPLTSEEMGNEKYFEKNPRQKNFLGVLIGLKEDRLQLSIGPQKKASQKDLKKPGSKSSKASMASPDRYNDTHQANTNSAEGNQITIPLPLISKANLEPDFDFETSDERE
jgi:ribosome maturation factor RimP